MDHKLQHTLQCLFEQGRDPMFIADLEGHIIQANPAFYTLYQYKEADIINQNSSILWQNALHDEAYYKAFMDKLRQEGRWSGELHITSKSGELIPVWTQIIRIEDSFAVTQVDLRERDKLTRKMEQFSRLQSVATLAGGVAHEFNNILGGIQGHLYLFKRQLDSTSKKDEQRFSRIDNLMNRATSLVQNLLAFSKQKTTAVGEVNLNVLLEETVTMYQKNMGTDIELTLSMPQQVLMVQADTVILKQHIFELIMNAESAILRKRGQNHVPEPSELIHVQLKLNPSNMVEIIVLDNGSGMQDAVLRHCLDPFFTTEPVGQGTGLGLSSALSYMQQLQGSLEVESVFGEYTKVNMTLPLLDDEQELITNKGKVLLIDDDDDLRDSIEEILVYNGYAVLTANNGLEGLDVWYAEQAEIDAIVMDIVMPNMDGIEMATLIRKENTNIPICLTTGYSQHSVPEHLHVNLIRKPLNPDLLLDFLKGTVHE